jgi:hypothetical protein
MFRGIAVLLALVFVPPATAHAATVSVDANGLLKYTAAAGQKNNVTFAESPNGTVTVGVGAEDQDPLVAGQGCTPGAGSTVVCPGVTSATIDAGDVSDRITAYDVDEDHDNAFLFGLTTIPAIITGGDGNDVIDGGGRADSIDGGPGDDTIDGFAGDDTIRGGDGNDELKPNTGSDTLVGGDGIDTAVYGRRATPSYTLDGLRNDGAAGENDLIGVDVENVEASADLPAQTVTIVGDGRGNRLTVQDGKGNITGGEGSDILEGAGQDDTFNSRDGSPDTVICNGGADTVLADTLDSVSPSCESVQVQATPGGPFDDRPPTLAWAAPAAGASITANAPTMLSVTAADDRGLSKVQFFDDDRLVCELTAPPYSCSYQPRGGDVGRNTLVAIAADGAGQTMSAVRAITVRRFSPKNILLSLRPSRDRKSPYAFRLTGKVNRPAAVSPSQACVGTVSLVARRGSRTISTHRVSVSTRTCEFRSTFKWRKRPTSRVRFQAKFGGSETLSKASSRTRTARLG